MRNYRLNYLFILLIIIAGSLALFFKIGETPPLYPWSDESEVAADAVESVETGLQLVYPIQRSGGAIGVWLETGWMALFGKSLLGLRILNGLVNLTAAVLLYLLVLELPFKFEQPSTKRWLAAGAGLLFAVSTWLLGLGRIATPNWSSVAVLAPLAFYFFWRGLNTANRWYAVAAGAVMGLLFYGYLPGYLVPAVPAAFIGLNWVVSRTTGDRRSAREFGPLPGNLGLWSFGAMLLVAAPILIYFASNPITILNRPLQVMDTNELSEGGSLVQGGLDTLSTFGFWPNWLAQGRFADLAFDPLVTVLFVVGVLLAVWRWREPAYLFVLVWWGVLISPAVLSGAASAGFIFEVWRRGVGAQPVSFIFPALAVVGLGQWLQQRWLTRSARRAVILPGLLGLTVLISASFSYQLYFHEWANSPNISTLFAQAPVRMVEWMEATGDDQTLFLFPRRPNVSYTTRPELFTVRYLYDGQAELAFPEMDEETVARTLSDLLTDDLTSIKLMMSERIAVDPKGYFEYVLGSQGELVARQSLPDYLVTTYRLRAAGPVEAEFQPTDVAFGEGLRLVSQHLQPVEVAAGRTVGVALRWAKVGPQDVDYNVRLSLHDRHDYERSSVDKPLLSQGDYLTTRHWSPGTESTLYVALSIPPDLPPGPYSLRVAAYEAETGVRLPPAAGRADLSLALAELTVAPNPVPLDPATLSIGQPLDVQLPDGLRLLGRESSAASINQPGDRLRVTLLWQATERASVDFGLMLALADSGTALIPLFDQPQPLIADYPTTEWPVGQAYRVNYPLLLPATLTTGNYGLALHLVDLDTGEPLAEQLLTSLSIEARAHVFEAPALDHQLKIDFADVIRLSGFEVEPFAPEQALTVHLQWQALREMSESYKLFLHLIDPGGQIVSQVDTLPQAGAAPTTSWLPGEIIKDELTLTIPKDLSAGTYQLVAGLYTEETGQRLMAGQQDHVVLFEQKIHEPNWNEN